MDFKLEGETDGKAVVLTVLVVAAFSISCDGGGVSGAAFAESYCAELLPCCAQAGRSTDGTTCRSYVRERAPADKSKADACVAGLHATIAAPDGCGRALTDVAAALDGAPLTLPCYDAAAGADCREDSDCAAPPAEIALCVADYSPSANVRYCQVLADGMAGDGPCLATRLPSASGGGIERFAGFGVFPAGYVCDTANGSYCGRIEMMTSTDTCIAQASVGAACASDIGCAAGSYCDSAAKLCATWVPHGGACVTGRCTTTDYCESTSMTCTTRLALGTACTMDSSCASGWCMNGQCTAVGPDLRLVCGSN